MIEREVEIYEIDGDQFEHVTYSRSDSSRGFIFSPKEYYDNRNRESALLHFCTDKSEHGPHEAFLCGSWSGYFDVTVEEFLSKDDICEECRKKLLLMQPEHRGRNLCIELNI